MRVLITGATGFVGSHIAEIFVKAGHQVRCTLRASSSPRWLEDLEVERTLVDFDEPESLVRALEGVMLVVHAAGLTRAKHDDDYYQVNAEGTERLAVAAARAGVRRFIHLSSLAARGPDGAHEPESAYGKSKLEAEGRLEALRDRLEIVVLRPAAVYGPRDRDLLPFFKMATRGFLAVPRSEGVLQPIYVTDVACAALAAVERGSFGPYPLAERGRYRWEESAKLLARALGHPIRLVRVPAAAFELMGLAAQKFSGTLGQEPMFDERRARDLARRTWTCDTSVTECALGWQANVSLPEGLAQTLGWYREAGWL